MPETGQEPFQSWFPISKVGDFKVPEILIPKVIVNTKFENFNFWSDEKSNVCANLKFIKS